MIPRWRTRDTVILIAVIAMFAFCLSGIIYVAVGAQDESAEEIFRGVQTGGYFESKDDEQDWTAFWLCREIDRLHDLLEETTAVLRKDIRELRTWLWAVLGSGVGGGGALAIRKLKNGKKKD